MKSKHLRHALGQLAEEGVTRVFKPLASGDWIIGVVGALQLDVLTARLAAEYDLGTRFDGAPCQAARWPETDDRAELERFRIKNPSASAEDHDGIPVFLARNDGNPGVVASSLLSVHQHTPDGPLIVFLYLDESEHPVSKMRTDIANHQIAPRLCFLRGRRDCTH